MKKLIALIATIVGICAFTGCSCNRQVFDFQYTYNYAIIYLQNGDVIEGAIKTWRDYSDGEQLQITMFDGTVYLTNSINCTLIYKEVNYYGVN